MLSLLRSQAQTKGLDLSFVWTTENPDSIATDPARFRQLLMNLVGNAIKFTSEGGVRIAARIDCAAQRLVVDVSDSGIGIPAGKLEDIFSPFRQADNSVTRRFGGTGLGLAISRHIAEGRRRTHRRQRTGQGQHLYRVDRRRPADRRPYAPCRPRRRAKPRTGSSQPAPAARVARNVSVEDGCATNRKLIRAILEQARIVVATAENGQVGVQIAARQSFDVDPHGHADARDGRLRGHASASRDRLPEAPSSHSPPTP